MGLARKFEKALAKLPRGTGLLVAEAMDVPRSTVMRRLRKGDERTWRVALKIGKIKHAALARAERLAERALELD